MIGYVARVVDAELDELFGGLPAIAIEGAKAVGGGEDGDRVEACSKKLLPRRSRTARRSRSRPLDHARGHRVPS